MRNFSVTRKDPGSPKARSAHGVAVTAKAAANIASKTSEVSEAPQTAEEGNKELKSNKRLELITKFLNVLYNGGDTLYLSESLTKYGLGFDGISSSAAGSVLKEFFSNPHNAIEISITEFLLIAISMCGLKSDSVNQARKIIRDIVGCFKNAAHVEKYIVQILGKATLTPHLIKVFGLMSIFVGGFHLLLRAWMKYYEERLENATKANEDNIQIRLASQFNSIASEYEFFEKLKEMEKKGEIDKELENLERDRVKKGKKVYAALKALEMNLNTNKSNEIDKIIKQMNLHLEALENFYLGSDLEETTRILKKIKYSKETENAVADTESFLNLEKLERLPILLERHPLLLRPIPQAFKNVELQRWAYFSAVVLDKNLDALYLATVSLVVLTLIPTPAHIVILPVVLLGFIIPLTIYRIYKKIKEAKKNQTKHEKAKDLAGIFKKLDRQYEHLEGEINSTDSGAGVSIASEEISIRQSQERISKIYNPNHNTDTNESHTSVNDCSKGALGKFKNVPKDLEGTLEKMTQTTHALIGFKRKLEEEQLEQRKIHKQDKCNNPKREFNNILERFKEIQLTRLNLNEKASDHESIKIKTETLPFEDLFNIIYASENQETRSKIDIEKKITFLKENKEGGEDFYALISEEGNGIRKIHLNKKAELFGVNLKKEVSSEETKTLNENVSLEEISLSELISRSPSNSLSLHDITSHVMKKEDAQKIKKAYKILILTSDLEHQLLLWKTAKNRLFNYAFYKENQEARTVGRWLKERELKQNEKKLNVSSNLQATPSVKEIKKEAEEDIKQFNKKYGKDAFDKEVSRHYLSALNKTDATKDSLLTSNQATSVTPKTNSINQTEDIKKTPNQNDLLMPIECVKLELEILYELKTARDYNNIPLFKGNELYEVLELGGHSSDGIKMQGNISETSDDPLKKLVEPDLYSWRCNKLGEKEKSALFKALNEKLINGYETVQKKLEEKIGRYYDELADFDKASTMGAQVNGAGLAANAFINYFAVRKRKTFLAKMEKYQESLNRLIATLKAFKEQSVNVESMHRAHVLYYLIRYAEPGESLSEVLNFSELTRTLVTNLKYSQEGFDNLDYLAHDFVKNDASPLLVAEFILYALGMSYRTAASEVEQNKKEKAKARLSLTGNGLFASRPGCGFRNDKRGRHESKQCGFQKSR